MDKEKITSNPHPTQKVGDGTLAENSHSSADDASPAKRKRFSLRPPSSSEIKIPLQNGSQERKNTSTEAIDKPMTTSQPKESGPTKQPEVTGDSPSQKKKLSMEKQRTAGGFSKDIFDQVTLVKNRLPSLSKPIALEEGEPPRGSRINIFVVMFMVLAFLIWASLTPITEVAVAPGQIIPSSFVKTIQHLEGGIVKEIFVQDGSEVKEGDVLLRLDEKAAISELEQLKTREAALRIRAERLRAVGLDQTPNFQQFGAEYQNLINDQEAIFEMQKKNRDDQREIIQKQIEQKKSALAVQEGRLLDLKHRVDVLTKQRDVLQDLYGKRLKTGTEYRAAEDSLAEVLVDLNQAKNSLQETHQAISEIESRLIELNTRLRNEALVEMGNVTAEIAQIKESMLKLQDRVSRLEIRAPSSGIVKGLKNTTLQGVIQPGAEILQIVPKDSMEVEARVLPKDVGRLREGQKVLVKVTAYEYPRFGGIEGKVKSVSATTFLDDKNNPYYRVFVSLHKYYVGPDANKNHVTPGMTVQADIETDHKTLIQYLFKPIYVAVHESFRER